MPNFSSHCGIMNVVSYKYTSYIVYVSYIYVFIAWALSRQHHPQSHSPCHAIADMLLSCYCWPISVGTSVSCPGSPIVFPAPRFLCCFVSISIINVRLKRFSPRHETSPERSRSASSVTFQHYRCDVRLLFLGLSILNCTECFRLSYDIYRYLFRFIRYLSTFQPFDVTSHHHML